MLRKLMLTKGKFALSEDHLRNNASTLKDALSNIVQKRRDIYLICQILNHLDSGLAFLLTSKPNSIVFGSNQCNTFMVRIEVHLKVKFNRNLIKFVNLREKW
jgi:hypothetical protein